MITKGNGSEKMDFSERDPDNSKEEACGKESVQEPGSEEESASDQHTMSRPVRTTVRVLGAALFLFLIWLVVMGSDAVIAWLKSLF